MLSKFTDVPSRDFKSMSMPGASAEVQRAVNAALEAMSTWRTDTVNVAEKNSRQVIEKMAAAARALGWPEQIVDVTDVQLQSITKMQIQALDHMLDAWEEEIKSPSSSPAMLSKLKSLPNFGAAGNWSGMDISQMAALNPFQLYGQFVEQWQKSCADAAAFWSKSGQWRHDRQ